MNRVDRIVLDPKRTYACTRTARTGVRVTMAPKGDIARRMMSVCTQQCMAVFWVRKRYTTCDM